MSLIVTFLLSCTSELSLSTATEILCYLVSQIYYLRAGNHKHPANMTSSVLLEVLEQELFSPPQYQVENPLTCLHGPPASHVVWMVEVRHPGFPTMA